MKMKMNAGSSYEAKLYRFMFPSNNLFQFRKQCNMAQPDSFEMAG